jgi:hypothetical protein
MVDEYRHRNSARIVMGLVVIAVGVLFTLDKLGYVRAGDFSEYWPVILIAIGLARIVQPRGTHGRGFGVFLLVLGSWFLLSNLDVVEYRVWDYWPVLLVLFGAMMIWRAIAGPPWRGIPRHVRSAAPGGEGPLPVAGSGASGGDTNATVSAVALLGGVKRRCVSQDFRGGDLTAVMGGCELDLRQASIKEGQAVLDTFAFWGGVEIRVPDDWTVVVQGTPILGAFEDTTVHTGEPGKKVLVIKGAAVMGGVEVKN